MSDVGRGRCRVDRDYDFFNANPVVSGCTRELIADIRQLSGNLHTSHHLETTIESSYNNPYQFSPYYLISDYVSNT